jgi:hypothetical protein
MDSGFGSEMGKRMGTLPRLLGYMEQRPLEPLAFKSLATLKKLISSNGKVPLLTSEPMKDKSCAKSSAIAVPAEMSEMGVLYGPFPARMLRLGASNISEGIR